MAGFFQERHSRTSIVSIGPFLGECSAAFVLAAAFGDNTAFTVTSDVRPGTRSFSSFSSAVAEIADARVFGGIHFRTSCVRANALGRTVADYVSRHAMRALGDNQNDEQD